MKLCFATNNLNKIAEISTLLGTSFEIISLTDLNCMEDLPETQATIEGNSQQKAAYIFNKYGTNCFADDTGLEVLALNGAPGVFSARYAGLHGSSEDNINLLLKNLEGIENRSAQFVTVITLIIEGGIYQFSGNIKGTILKERKGGKGFGYDPIFLPEGCERTFAEMNKEEKNKISHRGKAVSKMIDFLLNR